VPGRKAGTERVREGISEGFRPAQSGGVALEGRELKHLRGFSGGDDYDTSMKSCRLNRKD